MVFLNKGSYSNFYGHTFNSQLYNWVGFTILISKWQMNQNCFFLIPIREWVIRHFLTCNAGVLFLFEVDYRVDDKSQVSARNCWVIGYKSKWCQKCKIRKKSWKKKIIILRAFYFRNTIHGALFCTFWTSLTNKFDNGIGRVHFLCGIQSIWYTYVSENSRDILPTYFILDLGHS